MSAHASNTSVRQAHSTAGSPRFWNPPALRRSATGRLCSDVHGDGAVAWFRADDQLPVPRVGGQ